MSYRVIFQLYQTPHSQEKSAQKERQRSQVKRETKRCKFHQLVSGREGIKA